MVTSLANAGTPLMWAGCFHLVFGNAAIGVLEGWLLSRWFGTPRRRAILLMIPANYLSMLAGMGVHYLVSQTGYVDWDRAITIENVVRWHAIAALLLYVLTVVLEMPFCYLALRKSPRPVLAALVGCLGSQACSYLLLGLIAAPISALSPGITIAVREAASLTSEAPVAWVYFVSGDGRKLFRVRPDGQGLEAIADVPLGNEFQYLCVKFAKSGKSDSLDLVARGYKSREVLLLPDFVDRSQVSVDCISPADDVLYMPKSAMPFGGGARLASVEPPAWTVRTGFWGIEGLCVKRAADGHELRVRVETPLLSWGSRCASLLSDRFVVWGLGHQIVVLDIERQEMGLLAFGRAPLLVLDQAGAPEE